MPDRDPIYDETNPNRLTDSRDYWRARALVAERRNRLQWAAIAAIAVLSLTLGGALIYVVVHVDNRASAAAARQNRQADALGLVACQGKAAGLTNSAVNDLFLHPGDPAFDAQVRQALRQALSRPVELTIGEGNETRTYRCEPPASLLPPPPSPPG